MYTKVMRKKLVALFFKVSLDKKKIGYNEYVK